MLTQSQGEITIYVVGCTTDLTNKMHGAVVNLQFIPKTKEQTLMKCITRSVTSVVFSVSLM
jgi:hypothetical protein